MKSKRQCRKGPEHGPRGWGARRPPARGSGTASPELWCWQQEALAPAELLQRSLHVNQLDRQRAEKQGDEIRG